MSLHHKLKFGWLYGSSLFFQKNQLIQNERSCSTGKEKKGVFFPLVVFHPDRAWLYSLGVSLMLPPDWSCVRRILLPPQETPLLSRCFSSGLTPRNGSPHGLMLAGICRAGGCRVLLSELHQSAFRLDGRLEKHRVQCSKGCAMEEAQPCKHRGCETGRYKQSAGAWFLVRWMRLKLLSEIGALQ